jgi:mono/diheme cytochrome c family protein
MRKSVLRLFLIGSVLLLAQCAVKKGSKSVAANNPVTEEDIVEPPPPEKQQMLAAAEEVEHGATQYWLSQGKEILNNQCASCHGVKDPLKYSTENWVRHMSRMSPKAKLSEDQAKYLRVYTLALIKTSK